MRKALLGVLALAFCALAIGAWGQQPQDCKLGINFKPQSCMVWTVMVESPADKAGLGSGDTVVSINGVQVLDATVALSLLAKIECGATIRLGVIKSDKPDAIQIVEIQKVSVSSVSSMADAAAREKAKKRGSLPVTPEGKVQYQEVVQVEGANAQELYARAKRWVANAYKSARNVIQSDDPTNGQLVIKGLTEFSEKFMLGHERGWAHHTLTIQVKDGRYRYTLGDFLLEFEGIGSQPNVTVPIEDRVQKKRVQETQEAVAADAQALIASLKIAMLKPSPAADKSW